MGALLNDFLEGFQSGIPLLLSLVPFVHGPTTFVVSSLNLSSTDKPSDWVCCGSRGLIADAVTISSYPVWACH